MGKYQLGLSHFRHLTHVVCSAVSHLLANIILSVFKMSEAQRWVTLGFFHNRLKETVLPWHKSPNGFEHIVGSKFLKAAIEHYHNSKPKKKRQSSFICMGLVLVFFFNINNYIKESNNLQITCFSLNPVLRKNVSKFSPEQEHLSGWDCALKTPYAKKITTVIRWRPE